MTNTKADGITVTCSPEGKVTIENTHCRWGLLTAPVRDGSVMLGRPSFKAEAVCEFKNGKYAPRRTSLRLDASTALAVQIALAGRA